MGAFSSRECWQRDEAEDTLATAKYGTTFLIPVIEVQNLRTPRADDFGGCERVTVLQVMEKA